MAYLRASRATPISRQALLGLRCARRAPFPRSAALDGQFDMDCCSYDLRTNFTCTPRVPRHGLVMNTTLLVNIGIALALYIAPTGALVVTLKLARRRYQRKDRRNPLTKDLLRGPGHSLALELEERRADLGSLMAATAPIPLLAYVMYRTPQGWAPGAIIMAPALLFGFGYLVRRITTTVRQTHQLQLGLDAEIAIGQELNLLMRDGFWVFHDVKGDGPFNVDHVVVGPQGLFAVETKGRPKVTRADGEGHRVVLRDGRLAFPGWTETKALEQARRNAQWLGEWLSSAMGEHVAAVPVLALPGWYIDFSKERSDVGFINGTNSAAYFTKSRAMSLNDRQVQQIRHQLDMRCRDVKARAYAPSVASH